jgi:hypothetical protein
VPDELRDYLETVFDAYDRIVFDWPTEYRQIGGQDNYAEGASIVSRKSPLGPTRLTSIRKAYLATKRYIDDELFAQYQPFEDLDNNTQGQVYDLLMQARDGFFHGNAKMASEALRSVNDLCDDLDDNVYAFIKHKTGVDIFNLDSTKDQGIAEGLNEFAPDGFNGGDDDEGFSPEIAKMAQEDGFTKGVSLADGATLERAMTINHWHSQHGGIYKQYFAKGFKAGRMNKVKHDNRQYNLNLKLMKDGSIRHGEQGVAEGKHKEKEADYGADYQDMVSRVKKLAGLGPLKTVYDPQKRVYKNMPTATQPKKEQR